MTIALRPIESDDYPGIIAVVNDWWGGRAMADMLPRLFFVHFQATSFVAEVDSKVVGFLCGFVSQTYPWRAYIHFVGVDPATRGIGIGKQLYERFFAAAGTLGCTEVDSVTSPQNCASIAFHRAMGFVPLPGDAEKDGVSFFTDYDGPGEDRVRLRRMLDVTNI